jgi:hypothetical protein
LRIDNLNGPTNVDKLFTCFEQVGYGRLLDYEKTVLIARDDFHHGKLPVRFYTDDEVLQDVYHVCLVLHRLIYCLVLKQIGYDGYIIDYPQVHCHMTGKNLGERVFHKI